MSLRLACAHHLTALVNIQNLHKGETTRSTERLGKFTVNVSYQQSKVAQIEGGHATSGSTTFGTSEFVPVDGYSASGHSDLIYITEKPFTSEKRRCRDG